MTTTTLGLGLLTAPAASQGYAVSDAAVMVDGNTIFTVSGAPILILGLVSECVTDNNGTASTLQYSITPTVGAGAQTISNASNSLANATAGATVTLLGTALTTAANYNANGPNLSMTAPIYCPVGAIKMVIGTGSTTGTWRHRMFFLAMGPGVSVS